MAWVNQYPLKNVIGQTIDETTVFPDEWCNAVNPKDPTIVCTRMKGHVEGGSLQHGNIPNIKTGMKTSNIQYW